MPKLPTNVVKRPDSGRYQFRQAVPTDLQGQFGREVRKSLGTSDLATAKTRAAAISAELEAKYQRARSRAAISDREIAAEARGYYRALMDRDDDERRILGSLEPTPWMVIDLDRKESQRVSMDAFEIVQRRRERQQRHMARSLSRARIDDHALAQAREIAQKGGWNADPESDAIRELAHALMRAEREALDRAAERDEGRFGGEPADPLLAGTMPVESATEAPCGLSVLEAFERSAKLKSGATSENFIASERASIRLLDLFLGGAAPATAITKRALGRFRDALLEWPTGARHLPIDGKTFAEVVELGRANANRPISPKTINQHLDAAKRLGKYLASIDEIAEFDARAIRVERRKGDHHRPPFDDGDLRALFSLTELRDSGAPGWARWAPWIALHSGMRLGEILQLAFDDVREEEGVWCFDIRPGDGKSLKTAAARRLVPIHSAVLQAGFLEHVERRRKDGVSRPFAEAKRHPVKGFNYASNHFSRLIKRAGIEGKVFHSFRSTFIDAMRAADISPGEFKPLVGHEDGNVTRGYGRLPTGTVQRRKKIVESAVFDLPPFGAKAA